MADILNNNSDFGPFSRAQLYLDSLDPGLGDSANHIHNSRDILGMMEQYRQFPGRANPSNESYPPVPAYSSSSSIYSNAANSIFDTKSARQPPKRNTPSGSPCPSISQTFDHPPSTLSSASGASAQSTASSADGSPYASSTHHLPYQEKWSEPLRGLCIAPEIVNSEGYGQDSYTMTSLDNDLMLEDDKYPTFVGKSSDNVVSLFPLSQKSSSAIFHVSRPQNSVHPFPSLPLALYTTTSSRNVTIDSILQEANTRLQRPLRLMSPLSAGSPAASLKAFTGKCQSDLSVEHKGLFGSPMTLASG